MRIAIIGSRGIEQADIGKYVSSDDEIVSGGAKGVDSIAAEYAKAKGLKLVEFKPKYQLYGRAAPLKRNEEIVNYADKVIAFWDGKSKGTKYVINYAEKVGKPCVVVVNDIN